MKKNILIFIILISIVLIVIGVTMNLHSNNNSSVKKKNNKPLWNSEEIIDRSHEEAYIREQSGNQYFELNESKALSEERTFDILKINNIRLVRISEEWYSFTCFLENSSGEEYPASTFEIVFLDKDGNIIVKEEAVISSIPSGAVGTLSLSTKNKIIEAYDFNLVRKGDYIPQDSY